MTRLRRDIFDDIWRTPFFRDDWWGMRIFDIVEDGSTPTITKPSTSTVIKHKNRVEIQIILPGFKRDEISIVVDDRVLEVKAARIEKNVMLNRFSDSWRCHSVYDVDAITSKLEDGILYITVPYIKGTKKDSKKVISIK